METGEGCESTSKKEGTGTREKPLGWLIHHHFPRLTLSVPGPEAIEGELGLPHLFQPAMQHRSLADETGRTPSQGGITAEESPKLGSGRAFFIFHFGLFLSLSLFLVSYIDLTPKSTVTILPQ